MALEVRSLAKCLKNTEKKMGCKPFEDLQRWRSPNQTIDVSMRCLVAEEIFVIVGVR